MHSRGKLESVIAASSFILQCFTLHRSKPHFFAFLYFFGFLYFLFFLYFLDFTFHKPLELLYFLYPDFYILYIFTFFSMSLLYCIAQMWAAKDKKIQPHKTGARIILNFFHLSFFCIFFYFCIFALYTTSVQTDVGCKR